MPFFAIPSYKRSSLLPSKTLAMLSRFQVPMQNVYVFIVQEDEIDYQQSLSSYLTQGLHLEIGPLGLHHMRNHIRVYFPEGCELIQLDDDIEDIYQMEEDLTVENKQSCKRYPLRILSKEEFHTMIQTAFTYLREHHLHLFGIYPVRNGFFMKDLPEITKDLRFCVGVFWGCINQHSSNLMLELEEKEDVERTLRYYVQDQGVIRLNRIVPKTNYYKTAGGMQARPYSRLETSKTSCDYLLSHFRPYCKLYTSKKSGIYEIRLLTKPIVSLSVSQQS